MARPLARQADAVCRNGSGPNSPSLSTRRRKRSVAPRNQVRRLPHACALRSRRGAPSVLRHRRGTPPRASINGMIFLFEFRVWVGSQSEPMGTHHNAHFSRLIRALRPVWEGSHFGAEPHPKASFAPDSPLEQGGFEPSVPPGRSRLPGRFSKSPADDRSEETPRRTTHRCGQNPHISTSAPSSMTRSGGIRKKSVDRVATRARPE
jgi:hypothetical protein